MWNGLTEPEKFRLTTMKIIQDEWQHLSLTPPNESLIEFIRPTAINCHSLPSQTSPIPTSPTNINNNQNNNNQNNNNQNNNNFITSNTTNHHI